MSILTRRLLPSTIRRAAGAAVLVTVAALGLSGCAAGLEAQGRWGGPRPGYGRPARTSDMAYDNGYNDGYREGIDAARHGRRYDPVIEMRYRRADRGYDRRYGPRGLYQDTYRRGFTEGYEAGYRGLRFR
jgi:hypothetical protein